MPADLPTIDRHRTALVRTDLSRPVRLALEHGLLPDGASAFDYGCGHGGDVARLRERGVPVGCWDPYYAADQPLAESDLVNLGYVLNVIEDTAERADALRRAWSLARRVLVVSAQLLVDQAGATKVPFGDGFLTRLNTFQRYFDHAELGAYIHETLGVEPLAAAPRALRVWRRVQGLEAHFFALAHSAYATLAPPLSPSPTIPSIVTPPPRASSSSRRANSTHCAFWIRL